MRRSIRANTKKRGRPVTTGKGFLIGVRLLEKPLAALDHWIKAQPAPRPSRPEAIRRLVGEKLESNATARAVGASFAKKAAGREIDRALEGIGQSDDVKAQRKKRLTKIPRELPTKFKEPND